MSAALLRLDPQLPAEQPTRLSHFERRWLALVGSVLLVFTLAPLLIASMRTPEGRVFTGYVVIARDAFVYQALWRAGWHGAWLFHPAFTTEHLPGVLLYPWYIWSGHLLGWLPGPVLYHFSRVLAASALLLATYQLAAQLYDSVAARRLAFVLASLGGGIGVLIPPGSTLGPYSLDATESLVPGTSVSDLVSMAPHLPFAIALFCWSLSAAIRWRRMRETRAVLLGLAASGALTFIYPQLVVLLILVLGSWAVCRGGRRPAVFAAAASVLLAPYALYLAFLWKTSPDSLAVIKSSLEAGDPLGFLVLSHLVAAGLIVVGLVRRRFEGALLLPIFWIAWMTAFMFLPGLSGVLGRSFMGSSIPFGLAAVPGLLSLLERTRDARRRRRLAAACLAASSLFGVFSLAQPLWIAAQQLDANAEYESAGERELLSWLDPRSDYSTIVLSTYLDGVFVPAQTRARVYTGHPDMTIDARHKAQLANQFFTKWSAAERDTFLEANRIDYVLTTDRGSSVAMSSDPLLTEVKADGDAHLYEVIR